MSYKAIENTQKIIEVEFLKSLSYEEINDIIRDFKVKLDERLTPEEVYRAVNSFMDLYLSEEIVNEEIELIKRDRHVKKS